MPGLIAQGIGQVYRLTVIPAFRPPFVVRLAIRPDGTGTLVAKSAKSQDDAGALTLDRTEEIPKTEAALFLELVGKAAFWSMPPLEVYSKDPRVIVKVMGGVEWVLEGAQNEQYHIVTRTSPQPGPYTDMTSYLFRKLARLNVAPAPALSRPR